MLWKSNGLFRGHPVRPYYAATDAVGYLKIGLLQLDRAVELGDKLIGKESIPLPDGSVMGFDNL